MKRYALTPSATRDVNDIWDYIANASIEAADLVLSSLESATIELAKSPGIGHWREELADKRHRFLLVYSYLIVYRHEASPYRLSVFSMLRVMCKVSWDCRPTNRREKNVIQETPSLDRGALNRPTTPAWLIATFSAVVGAIGGIIAQSVGLVNSAWSQMAMPKSDYRGIPLRDRRATTRRRAEDVDRLLEDQFDSHLFPLHTGMGSRSFRLRAVRTCDGDRRLAG
jgi:toxin ParE1/3/4